jgi:IS30 family transposase
MSYTHLTREERYQIYALKEMGHTQHKIAEALGRSPATMSRKLRRNRGARGRRNGAPRRVRWPVIVA